MSVVIERALATATTCNDDTDILALEAEIKRLTDLHNDLLPAEGAAKMQIAAKGRELRQRLENIAAARQLNLPMLDPTILAWTKIQPAWHKIVSRQLLNVPVFAYLPLSERSCSISVSRHGDGISGPQFVQDQYVGMLLGLRKHLRSSDDWGGRTKITLSYSYGGVLPKEIREIVKTEQITRRFDELALICEVDKWEINEQHVPRQLLDPILVGVKSDALWVLGSFDPTPVEDYVAREFTS